MGKLGGKRSVGRRRGREKDNTKIYRVNTETLLDFK